MDIKVKYFKDNPDFDMCESLKLFEVVTGGKPRLETEARICYTDKGIYIKFHGEDDYLVSTMKNFNDPIYDEDVFEAFFDDDCDRRTYKELEVSPLGTVLHYEIHKSETSNQAFARIENNIGVSVLCGNDFWEATIFVPNTEFLNPPVKGSRFLGNLYRIDRGREGNDEHSALSPTGEINYHRPDKFVSFNFE
ncbi:MAG: carbohydrate-binding family 9-like protein [Oscillospiraceae bacterium]